VAGQASGSSRKRGREGGRKGARGGEGKNSHQLIKSSDVADECRRAGVKGPQAWRWVAPEMCLWRRHGNHSVGKKPLWAVKTCGRWREEGRGVGEEKKESDGGGSTVIMGLFARVEPPAREAAGEGREGGRSWRMTVLKQYHASRYGRQDACPHVLPSGGCRTASKTLSFLFFMVFLPPLLFLPGLPLPLPGRLRTSRTDFHLRVPAGREGGREEGQEEIGRGSCALAGTMGGDASMAAAAAAIRRREPAWIWTRSLCPTAPPSVAGREGGRAGGRAGRTAPAFRAAWRCGGSRSVVPIRWGG
jgi:hypothetical protein